MLSDRDTVLHMHAEPHFVACSELSSSPLNTLAVWCWAIRQNQKSSHPFDFLRGHRQLYVAVRIPNKGACCWHTVSQLQVSPFRQKKHHKTGIDADSCKSPFELKHWVFTAWYFFFPIKNWNLRQASLLFYIFIYIYKVLPSLMLQPGQRRAQLPAVVLYWLMSTTLFEFMTQCQQLMLVYSRSHIFRLVN